MDQRNTRFRQWFDHIYLLGNFGKYLAKGAYNLTHDEGCLLGFRIARLVNRTDVPRPNCCNGLHGDARKSSLSRAEPR